MTMYKNMKVKNRLTGEEVRELFASGMNWTLGDFSPLRAFMQLSAVLKGMVYSVTVCRIGAYVEGGGL